MTPLNRFLKVLKKVGYPNPQVETIATMVDYDLEEFLFDLIAEVGENGTDNFTMNAIMELSEGDKGIKVPVNDDYYDEYAYIKIHSTRVDLDNDTTTVLVSWSWGETRILSVNEDEEEVYITIQQLYDDAGMGDMGDLEDLWDRIKNDCSNLIYNNCGFGVWYDDFIK